MNISEPIHGDVVEATPADGRWVFIEGDPTAGVTINVTGRSADLDVTALRKMKATVVHLLEAETVTSASLAAAIAAEFAE